MEKTVLRAETIHFEIVRVRGRSGPMAATPITGQ
jgi:hypothetical protein